MSYFTYQGRELFYQEAGQGEPCIFLHGNTASSRMFTFLLPLYTQHFRVILLDFLGNGKSQRVDTFPEELWIDQGRQAAELCRHLVWEGKSGGDQRGRVRRHQRRAGGPRAVWPGGGGQL